MAEPFRYDKYTSPYVGSISQLIAAPGEAQARALEIAGQAQANAALQRGAAYGNAVQNIGQTIASIPGQIQQYKAAEQQQQFRRAQISDMQAQEQQRVAAAKRLEGVDQANKAIDGIMQQSMRPDPSTGVVSFDRPTFEQQLVQGGMGHLYPQLAETLDKLDASASKRNAEGRSMLAHSLVGIEQAGYTPDAVLSAAAYLKANNVISADHLQPVLAALADDSSPETVKRIVTGLGQQIPEYQALKTAEEKRTADLAKSKAESGKIAAETAKLEAEVAGTLPLTPAQKQTAEHQAATLKLAQETERRQGVLAASTIQHQRALEAQNNPLAALTAQPGGAQGAAASAQAAGPTGDEFLKTLPGPIASEVKAYAEGRRPFPTGFSLKSPYFQSLIQMVGQYDPTFDAANYNARANARKDLTGQNTAGGKTINALNTALQHAGKLSDLIETLDNTEYSLLNAPMNVLRSAGGSTKVTNFQAVAPQLMKEIERAWRGTGGSTADIKDLIASLGSNLGKQQQREALENFVELVQGKIDATRQQRDNVLGPIAAQDIPVLFKQNESVIEKIANRAANKSSGVTALPPGVTVTKRP